MSDLVQAYLYDITDQNKYLGTIMVKRSTPLSSGETYIKPKDGLYGKPRFDENKLDWFGITREEWLKTNPFHDNGNNNQPSAQQALMANLMKENASLQKQVKAQATVNATIMKSIAELKSETK